MHWYQKHLYNTNNECILPNSVINRSCLGLHIKGILNDCWVSYDIIYFKEICRKKHTWAHTLCCISLRRCCFGLETRAIIKFWPILATQETLTDFHRDEAKKFFLKKSFKNGRLKKTEFFKTANAQYLFTKISGIGP